MPIENAYIFYFGNDNCILLNEICIEENISCSPWCAINLHKILVNSSLRYSYHKRVISRLKISNSIKAPFQQN